MYELIYSETSSNDLKAIFTYIAADNRNAAVNYMKELEKSLLNLKEFPFSGPLSKYKELMGLSIRILPHDRYLIFYTLDEKNKQINILRILHSSVNYPNLF